MLRVLGAIWAWVLHPQVVDALVVYEKKTRRPRHQEATVFELPAGLQSFYSTSASIDNNGGAGATADAGASASPTAQPSPPAPSSSMVQRSASRGADEQAVQPSTASEPVEAMTKLELDRQNAALLRKQQEYLEEQAEYQKAVQNNAGVPPTKNAVHLVQQHQTQTGAATQIPVAQPLGGSAAMASGPGSSAGVNDMPKGPKPKGWDQCVKFAREIKGQGVFGVELVRTWQSTCEPAVLSGVATERYKLMCDSLAGAVEPFSNQIDYNVFKLCDSVLTIFHDVLA